MLARLEHSVIRIQRFTADAAHELRTPLTALRTTAELAIRRRRDPGEYQEALADVAAIASRMGEQLEQLLSLARGDTCGPLFPAPVRLGDVTREVCRCLQPLFDAAKVRLAVQVDADLAPALGDPAALRRLMTALLENAVKYTPADGAVTVSVRRDRSGQTWEIADTGCGIPEESIPQIFDRFYRADASRDRRTGGYGLGLAIADQIARQHNTRIEVRSHLGEGTTFLLRFPSSPIEL
jgi:signal transduction histidine kinase